MMTTASIGIAIYPTDSVDEEGLFKRADSAMCMSKQSGRNAIYYYSDLVG
jgi:GGDEF domain-containing protein